MNRPILKWRFPFTIALFPIGVLREQFEGQSLEGISGLHFHTLCEKNSDALERTLERFEDQFKIPSLR
ncbi:MAG: hypothetical protein R2874_13350 [Desulfobacterales bacterium]